MSGLLGEIKYLIAWGDGKGVTVYGFLIAVAILAGGVFGYLLAKKRNYPADIAIDVVLWCVPLAIVGARLYYVIFTAICDGQKWGFLEMFAVWDGGLAVYGGILFAILGCFLLSIFYKKRKKPDEAAINSKIESLEIKIKGTQDEKIKKKLTREKAGLADGLKPKPSFFQMADLGAPFLILGQAIGRIGCYYSECCYGNPVTNPNWQWLPFAVPIASDGGNWHLATFFYESAWCLIGLAVMLYFSLSKKKRWQFDGFVFAFYLMFYGLGRFILEFLRVESSETLWLIPGAVTASMAVAVIMFLWGAYIMARAFFFRKAGVISPSKENRPTKKENEDK